MKTAISLLLLCATTHAFRTPARLLAKPKTRLLAPRATAAPAAAAAPPLAPRLGGVAALCALDEVCRAALKTVAVPHSLAGGGALVAALIALGGRGEKTHSRLLARGGAPTSFKRCMFFVCRVRRASS